MIKRPGRKILHSPSTKEQERLLMEMFKGDDLNCQTEFLEFHDKCMNSSLFIELLKNNLCRMPG